MVVSSWIFEKLFTKDNGYFGDYYLDFDVERMRSFFKDGLHKHQTFTHLYFYLESLTRLQNLPNDFSKVNFEEPGAMAGMHSSQLWYATVIQILIGLIQQQNNKSETELPCECCGHRGRIKNIFLCAMDSLKEDQKKYLIRHYKSSAFAHKDFKSVCLDIYADRNFFAHEINKLKTPDTLGLSYDMKPDGIYIKFNIKPEEILLYVVIALTKTMGYSAELDVHLNKEIRDFSDLL
jgi:hypothetical protein